MFCDVSELPLPPLAVIVVFFEPLRRSMDSHQHCMPPLDLGISGTPISYAGSPVVVLLRLPWVAPLILDRILFGVGAAADALADEGISWLKGSAGIAYRKHLSELAFDNLPSSIRCIPVGLVKSFVSREAWCAMVEDAFQAAVPIAERLELPEVSLFAWLFVSFDESRLHACEVLVAGADQTWRDQTLLS